MSSRRQFITSATVATFATISGSAQLFAEAPTDTPIPVRKPKPKSSAAEKRKEQERKARCRKTARELSKCKREMRQLETRLANVKRRLKSAAARAKNANDELRVIKARLRRDKSDLSKVRRQNPKTEAEFGASFAKAKLQDAVATVKKTENEQVRAIGQSALADTKLADLKAERRKLDQQIRNKKTKIRQLERNKKRDKC